MERVVGECLERHFGFKSVSSFEISKKGKFARPDLVAIKDNKVYVFELKTYSETKCSGRKIKVANWGTGPGRGKWLQGEPPEWTNPQWTGGLPLSLVGSPTSQNSTPFKGDMYRGWRIWARYILANITNLSQDLSKKSQTFNYIMKNYSKHDIAWILTVVFSWIMAIAQAVSYSLCKDVWWNTIYPTSEGEVVAGLCICADFKDELVALSQILREVYGVQFEHKKCEKEGHHFFYVFFDQNQLCKLWWRNLFQGLGISVSNISEHLSYPDELDDWEKYYFSRCRCSEDVKT